MVRVSLRKTVLRDKKLTELPITELKHARRQGLELHPFTIWSTHIDKTKAFEFKGLVQYSPDENNLRKSHEQIDGCQKRPECGE